MFVVILFTILGLCLGSWFNVVVFRGVETEREHCKGQRSECPSCGHKLSPLDLVPVFSWLFLGGRCRYCKEKISWIYPVGEALTALGFAVVGTQVAQFVDATGLMWKPEYIVTAIEFGIMLFTVVALSVSTISDIREKMIYVMPVYIVTGLVVIGRLVQFIAQYNLSGMLFHRQVWVCRLVMFVGLILVFTVLKKVLEDKMGDGDFDILLLLYVSGGINTMFNSMFIGSIVGCLGVLALCAVKRFKKGTAIPMVPLLYIGYLVQIYIDLIKLPF